MKAFLLLEDGTVFCGSRIGSDREVIREMVFNTSMTGYLEVLTDPSYAGQAVVMTYPLIGNYGVCMKIWSLTDHGQTVLLFVNYLKFPAIFEAGTRFSISWKNMIFLVSAVLIQEPLQKF